MKTSIQLLALLAWTAACAGAQDNPSPEPAAPPPPSGATGDSAPGPRLAMPGRDGPDRPGGPMSPEMIRDMRAAHQAIRDLAQAARTETNETKKTEIVSQLRAKLVESADRMQAHQEERLAQAEQQLATLRERIQYAKDHRDELVDEQIEHLLSGSPMPRPDPFDKFPYGKGGRRGPGGDGMPPPEGFEGGRPPPPPHGDFIFDDRPPPPPPGDDPFGDRPPPPPY